jgi:RNA polymerase sigma factor (sigma-70 family)
MTIEDSFRILRDDPRNALAWEAIALSVYGPTLAYAASLLMTFRVAPGETAEDIVQEVLVKFYERWPKIGEEIRAATDIQSYLRRSCRNLLIDRYRHEKRAEPLIHFLSLNFSQAFRQDTDVHRSIFVQEIINGLPKDCASLLQAYVTEDLSPAAIADRLGASPGTFYARWYRCIQKAKAIFLQKGPGPKH